MRTVAFATSILLLGCGINEGGLLEVLDGSPDALDGNTDVIEEPFVCEGGAPASCTDAVPFRTPALFSPDAAAPCPSGYDTHDLTLATPQSLNCSCQCADAGAPTCDTSGYAYHYGFGLGGCVGGNGTTPTSGACTPITTNNTTYMTENLQVDPPAFSGGCGGGTSVPPTVTNAKARLCTPTCASDERMCAAQGALLACVSVGGDVGSCPPNYPTGPFHIGTAPQATCDACICNTSGDCASSVVHLFTDTGCTQGDQTYAMDGACHALTGGQINTFRSTNIQPVPNYQCKVTEGAAHITYAPNSDFTVCCP